MSTHKELIAANPHLTPYGRTQDRVRLAVQNLRADLEHAGITASVKSRRTDGGSALLVYVLDEDQIENAQSLADRYEKPDYTLPLWFQIFGGAQFAFARLAVGVNREKLMTSNQAPPMRGLTDPESWAKFCAGVERGTESTVARYVDAFKDDSEKMATAWWVATQEAAMAEEHYGVLRVLVEQGGIDPNTKTGVHSTPALHLVLDAPDIAGVLLEHGADPRAVDKDGNTPMSKAVIEGYSEVVELLLNSGVDPNVAQQDQLTPLHTVLLADWCEGQVEVIRALLNAGADPNEPDDFGKTHLHTAAEYGEADVMELLINAGADPNAASEHGSTPLHLAALSGGYEAVKLLINSGADPNISSSDGMTPLFFAQSQEMAQAFIDAGGDPSIKAHDGQTADAVVENSEVRSIYRQYRLNQIAQSRSATSNTEDNDLATPEQALAARRARYGRAM